METGAAERDTETLEICAVQMTEERGEKAEKGAGYMMIRSGYQPGSCSQHDPDIR